MVDDEKRALIAKNKAAALIRRAVAKEKEAELSKVCQTCSSDEVLKMYQEVFAELICKRCAAHDEDWQMMNKTSATATFLLPDDTFRHLKFKATDNPHRKGWAEMKLYLRRHLRIEAEQRFGGAEKLTQERQRRDAKKLHRDLASAKEQASMREQGQGQGTDELVDTATSSSSPSFSATTMSTGEFGGLLDRMLMGGTDAMFGAAASLRTNMNAEVGEGDKTEDSIQAVGSSSKKRKQPIYPSYKEEKNDGDDVCAPDNPSKKKHRSAQKKTGPNRLAGMLSAIRGST